MFNVSYIEIADTLTHSLTLYQNLQWTDHRVALNVLNFWSGSCCQSTVYSFLVCLAFSIFRFSKFFVRKIIVEASCMTRLIS